MMMKGSSSSNGGGVNFKKAKSRCIGCNITTSADVTLLPCATPTCPLSFHEHCCVPPGDDPFYCPHCSYSRYISLSDQASLSLISANHNLEHFLTTTRNNNNNQNHTDDADDDDDDTDEYYLAPAKPLPSSVANCTVPISRKPKRVLWSPQEEDMLKEGICKFASDDKSIPWKLILEFGSHIFHSSRNPESLRNKWKNNLAKDCSPLADM